MQHAQLHQAVHCRHEIKLNKSHTTSLQPVHSTTAHVMYIQPRQGRLVTAAATTRQAACLHEEHMGNIKHVGRGATGMLPKHAAYYLIVHVVGIQVLHRQHLTHSQAMQRCCYCQVLLLPENMDNDRTDCLSTACVHHVSHALQLLYRLYS